MVRLEMTVPKKASAVGVRVYVDGRKIDRIESISLEGFNKEFELKSEETADGLLVWCELDAVVDCVEISDLLGDPVNKLTIRRRNGKS